MDFVKEVLRDIVSGIEDKNVEELLRQAESILQDIVSKNFYDARQRSMDEVEKAMEGKATKSVASLLSASHPGNQFCCHQLMSYIINGYR